MNPSKAPPKSKLRELVDTHVQIILEEVQRGTKGYTPTLLVEHYDPATERTNVDVVVLQVNFNDMEEKRNVLRLAGKRYYDEKKFPVGVALASEAWLSSQTHVMPSQADDRREVVFVAALGVDGSGIMTEMIVKRDRDEKILPAAFVEMDQGGKVEFKFPLLKEFYIGFAEPVMNRVRR